MLYNINNKPQISKWLNTEVTATVTAIYGEALELLEAELQKALLKTRTASVALRTQLVDTFGELPDTNVSEAVYSASIKQLTDNKEQLSKLWLFRAYALRIALLATNLDPELSTKRISFKARKVLEAVVSGLVRGKKNYVSIGEVVHNASKHFKTTDIVTKEGTHLGEPDAWAMDELCLQIINELCEQNFLDLRVVDRTHVLSIPANLEKIVSQSKWLEMAKQARILAKKTILTTIPELQRDQITTSSWWYKTPELSDDMRKFIEIMSNVKFQFKATSPLEIEDLYREHLDVSKLESWAKLAVSEFHDQIGHSMHNGGHHILGQFDSALRYYFQAEIGHFQTSSALRSIVEVAGIKDPVKYDMRNNVVQMYSIGLGSHNLATYVGLTAELEAREDLRILIAKQLNEELGVTVFDKDNIKPIFMVWAYNAGKDKILDGVFTQETNPLTGVITTVNKVLGLRTLTNHTIEGDTLWDTWSSVVEALVPEIVALKVIFKRLIKGNPLTETSWILPDGGIAQYASAETVQKTLHFVSSNGTVRSHTHHRKEIVEDAKAAGLLPRVIHSIDAYFMRQLVIRAHALGIIVIPNHDSFLFDRSHTYTVIRLAKELLIEIKNDHVLANIIDQLNKSNAKLFHGITMAPRRLTDDDILAGMPMATEEI